MNHVPEGHPTKLVVATMMTHAFWWMVVYYMDFGSLVMHD
jgi:hypothetical protein